MFVSSRSIISTTRPLSVSFDLAPAMNFGGSTFNLVRSALISLSNCMLRILPLRATLTPTFLSQSNTRREKVGYCPTLILRTLFEFLKASILASLRFFSSSIRVLAEISSMIFWGRPGSNPTHGSGSISMNNRSPASIVFSLKFLDRAKRMDLPSGSMRPIVKYSFRGPMN